MPTGQYKQIQDISVDERKKTISMKRMGSRSLRNRGRFGFASLIFIALTSCVATFGLSRYYAPQHLTEGQLQVQLEEKVQTLSDHIARVRKYEDQLKLRSSALKQVVDEAKQLDQPSASSTSGNTLVVSPTSKSRTLGGMGGGESRHSPLYQVRPSSALETAPITRFAALADKTPAPKNILDAAAFRMEEFRHLPVGVPVQGEFTSLFGRRSDPFSQTSQFHEGVDISVDQMSPVMAVADGVIVNAGWKGAYGNAVVISHGGGYETLYGHLSRVTVREGEKVCRGQQIGYVGSTGHSTGPHVHYEVRYNDIPRNPAPFIKLTGVLEALG